MKNLMLSIAFLTLLVSGGCSSVSVPREPGHYIDLGHGLIHSDNTWNTSELFQNISFEMEELERDKVVFDGKWLRYVFVAEPGSIRSKTLYGDSAIEGFLYNTTTKSWKRHDDKVCLDTPDLLVIDRSNYNRGIVDRTYIFDPGLSPGWYILRGFGGYLVIKVE